MPWKKAKQKKDQKFGGIWLVDDDPWSGAIQVGGKTVEGFP